MFKIEYEEKSNIKNWMILSKTEWCFYLGVIGSVAVILWFRKSGALVRRLVAIVVFMSCLSVCLWVGLRLIKYKWKATPKYREDNWKRELIFEEEEIIVTEFASKGIHTNCREYKEIVGVIEDGTHITVKMESSPNILFRKDAFVIGTWEECKRYIVLKRKQTYQQKIVAVLKEQDNPKEYKKVVDEYLPYQNPTHSAKYEKRILIAFLKLYYKDFEEAYKLAANEPPYGVSPFIQKIREEILDEIRKTHNMKMKVRKPIA